jgi:hypothetical protein
MSVLYGRPARISLPEDRVRRSSSPTCAARRLPLETDPASVVENVSLPPVFLWLVFSATIGALFIPTGPHTMKLARFRRRRARLRKNLRSRAKL